METGPCHHGTRQLSGGEDLKTATVYLVTPSGNYRGTLSFNMKEIYFVSDRDSNDAELIDHAAVTLAPRRRMRRRRWVMASLCAIFLRRYRLRDTALEVFLRRGKHRNFFVDFGHLPEDAKLRNSFARLLMEVAPKHVVKQWPGTSSYRILTNMGIQEKWQNGDLSNLDYLMALNTISGRSYSDLTQYPVLPWVLAEYTKDTIDLCDPNSFRDLSKPMGAQTEQRLAEFMDRYTSSAFGDADVPPFMYGSHYSTMVGVVLHFLVRLQPFAALHQDIQNGHFDVPDRLFSSIPRTWEHNTTMLSEVKELTPEWYMLPDFLRNINNFDFGLMQDGHTVNDVELPPWANSPEEFIRINREALESDYVSAHIHEWIDLIFGFKQRGPAAVEACNVFYYLTYSGSVKRDMISEEPLRKAIELQIAHFGQCPAQLFSNPHPPKRGGSVPRPLRRCFDELTQSMVSSLMEDEVLSSLSYCTLVPRVAWTRVLNLVVLLGRIACILENGVIEVYRYGIAESARTANVSNVSSRSYLVLRQLEAARLKNIGLKLKLKRPRLLRGQSQLVPPEASKGSEPTQVSHQDSVKADSVMESPWDEMGANIISFDAEDMHRSLPPPPSRNTTPENNKFSSDQQASNETDNQTDLSSIDASDGTSAIAREVLIIAEKDATHFEVVPRVPLAVPKATSSAVSTPAVLSTAHKLISDTYQCPSPGGSVKGGYLSVLEAIASARLTHFTTSGSIILTCGHADGSVAVREIDTLSAVVRTGCEFRAHRHPVIFVSSDNIPGGFTDVIVSIDAVGIVLVWTLSMDKNTKTYSLSRRPQRLLRCFHGKATCCDLSWHMGIVIGASGGTLSLFSIERNERLRCIDIRKELCGDGHSSEGMDCLVLHICVCNDGLILTHTAMFRTVLLNEEKSSRHFICSHTVSGYRTGLLQAPSPVTFMACPGRSSVLLAGHMDGTVRLFDAHNCDLLYEYNPMNNYVCCPIASDNSGGGRVSPSSSKLPSDIEVDAAAAAILCVKVGPNVERPAVMCISNASGAIFIRALPDYVRWERTRVSSPLSQILSVPANVVRQAQAWTSDTAGALLVNAKTMSDEALKRINKSKIFKGVGQLFGMGGASSGVKDV